MREITIDCASIDTRAAFHDALAEAFSFPDWYGRNLDALHDLLTAVSEETHIQFLNWSTAETTLGRYAAASQKAIDHAASVNSNLTVEYR